MSVILYVLNRIRAIFRRANDTVSKFSAWPIGKGLIQTSCALMWFVDLSVRVTGRTGELRITTFGLNRFCDFLFCF
jgi:hypothetical protein